MEGIDANENRSTQLTVTFHLQHLHLKYAYLLLLIKGRRRQKLSRELMEEAWREKKKKRETRRAPAAPASVINLDA